MDSTNLSKPSSSKKGSARHLARRAALQALYQYEFNAEPAPLLITHFKRLCSLPTRIDFAYFENLVQGVVTHQNLLDERLKPYLDRNAEEINLLERNILRIAAFEILYQSEIPPRVVMNEAIELAKAFTSPQGYKYINTVLDKFMRPLGL